MMMKTYDGNFMGPVQREMSSLKVANALEGRRDTKNSINLVCGRTYGLAVVEQDPSLGIRATKLPKDGLFCPKKVVR